MASKEKTFLEVAEEKGITQGVVISINDKGQVNIVSSYEHTPAIIYMIEKARHTILTIEDVKTGELLAEEGNVEG